MAWVTGGKHFGQYTYEHWFDEDFEIRRESIMQKEIVKIYVDYNKSVNDTMNGIIKTLSQAEWEKPLGGYFPSVRSLCSHIYISDFNWLKRLRGFKTFAALNDPLFDKTYSHKETLFENMGEYLSARSDMDNRMSAFVNELTDADLGGTLKFTDPHGKVQEQNFGGCVLRFLTHEIHHRGGISIYLDMLGRDNDFSSLGQVLK